MIAPRLLAALLALGAAACASSGAVPRPFPGAPVAGTGTAPATPAPVSPNVPAAPAAPASRFDPNALLRTALDFRGVPYRNGGSDPSGFDCSGFVQYVFAQHGLALPREVREQFMFGEDVDPADARAGDLVYFSTVERGPSHVGLVIDGEAFVHAPSSRGSVRVERFDVPYWSSRVVGIKRLR